VAALGTASGLMEKKGQRQQGSGGRETRRQRSKIEQQVESRINNQNQSMIVHPALHWRCTSDAHRMDTAQNVCVCVRTDGGDGPNIHASALLGAKRPQPSTIIIHGNQQRRRNHPITVGRRGDDPDEASFEGDRS
jgi:hypothetical protein